MGYSARIWINGTVAASFDDLARFQVPGFNGTKKGGGVRHILGTPMISIIMVI